jgi:hypothetical protein
MPTVQQTAPRSNTRGDSLADILERVLDTGIVIAGDIRVQLADIELLTIQIRLIICSVDKAQQLGMDWWKGASFLTSDAIPAPQQATEAQTPSQLGAEHPSTVADMQSHFETSPAEAPTWAATPEPNPAQQPWSQEASGQPQHAPQPQQPPEEPPQPQSSQPPQTSSAPAPEQPQANNMSDVQAEMLNERLARLEAVLERLIPPEE